MKRLPLFAVVTVCAALFAFAGCEESNLQPPSEQSMYGGAEGSGELAAYSAQAKPHIITFDGLDYDLDDSAFAPRGPRTAAQSRD